MSPTTVVRGAAPTRPRPAIRAQRFEVAEARCGAPGPRPWHTMPKIGATRVGDSDSLPTPSWDAPSPIIIQG
jgi:hypothetical protein